MHSESGVTGQKKTFMSSNEKAVAEKLLQINAIRLNPQHPFTWA
jgi:hypothetical protein